MPPRTRWSERRRRVSRTASARASARRSKEREPSVADSRRDERHVDESAARPRLPPGPGQRVHETVEDVIAHEGSGRVRHLGGNLRADERGRDCLHREGGKIGGRSARDHRLVERLLTGVVGDAGIVEVHGHALGRHDLTTPGYAAADNGRRAQSAQLGTQCAERFAKHARQLTRGHARPGDHAAIEPPHGLPRRIDHVAPKRIETGEEDGGGGQEVNREW